MGERQTLGFRLCPQSLSFLLRLKNVCPIDVKEWTEPEHVYEVCQELLKMYADLTSLNHHFPRTSPSALEDMS